MSGPDAALLVFGATGLVGRGVCRALAAWGLPFEIAGRSEAALAEVAAEVPVAHAHVADARDAASLARAFAGARVVIDAAGPLADTAVPVLEAALTAGAHYVDVGGEQAALHRLHERHESAARRAGLVALPGAGLDCVIGDLAAAWAAAHVVGAVEDGDAVRTAPGARLADDRPLDEIAVSYVFDDLALSAGSQRALFGAAFERALVWRRDRWEAGRPGEVRRVNPGAALGGERDAIAHAGGDALAIPRHVATRFAATYLSTSATRAGARLRRLVATALPLVPRRAAEVLAPYTPTEDELAGARFAVIAQVRRGFAAAQIVVRGRDLYATTATIAAWTARQLAARGAGPIGMRAPGELFHPAAALRELAAVADLGIEPSFGA